MSKEFDIGYIDLNSFFIFLNIIDFLLIHFFFIYSALILKTEVDKEFCVPIGNDKMSFRIDTSNGHAHAFIMEYKLKCKYNFLFHK